MIKTVSDELMLAEIATFSLLLHEFSELIMTALVEEQPHYFLSRQVIIISGLCTNLLNLICQLRSLNFISQDALPACWALVRF